MTTSPNANEVRILVQSYFRQLGVPSEAVTKLEETARVDRGRIVARGYRAGELFAMWLVEIGLLQFYDPEGEMLLTVNLLEKLQATRLAA